MKLTNIIKESKTIQRENKGPCWDGYEQIGMKMKGGKEVPNCVPKNEVNEASKKIPLFIPNVGNIDDFKLKSLLQKNPKVKTILGDKEFKFLNQDNTDVIMVSGKPFNSITTDGKLEFELDLKKNILVKPLGKARPKIVAHYSQNKAVSEATHTSQPGEWVGYIETPKGDKLMGRFKTARAAKMWLNKNNNKLLNTDGVTRVGIMGIDNWNKFHAKWAVESVNEMNVNKKFGSKNEISENKTNWKDFYKMAKDTSEYNPSFEKKYGNILNRPHIVDALKRTKDFSSFMKFIQKFESMRESRSNVALIWAEMDNSVKIKFLRNNNFAFPDVLAKRMYEKLPIEAKYEFRKFIKESVNESVNETKEFPSKEKLVAYMVKGGHNKKDSEKVVDANYEYVKKHYKNAGIPKISDILWTVESVNESVNVNKKFGSKYDIGAGSMGNGTTFWNRAQEVSGDYKTIAHVSDNGKVTFYDKKLPNNVKKHIEDYAKTKTESIKENTGCGCGGAKTTNPYSLSEFVVKEGRNIQKIQKDYNDTVLKLKSTLEKYKEAKGTPNEKKWIDELKKLTVLKKKYQSELDKGVQDLYKDAEYEGE